MIRQENLETGQFDMVSGKKLNEAIASILNAHPSIERVRMRSTFHTPIESVYKQGV